jgi:hypothetical protein
MMLDTLIGLFHWRTPLPHDEEANDNGNGDNNDNDNDNTLNTSISSCSDIVGIGIVQNISQPVNALSHNPQENRGYLHAVGEVENGTFKVNRLC